MTDVVLPCLDEAEANARVPVQFLVIAKAPVPGRVKTRLCPPCTPTQAAAVAAAALADTLDAVGAARAVRHTTVLSGRYSPPSGWRVVAQRGDGLDERLAHAFADTALPGVASVLVGMDTPQVRPALLDAVVAGLDGADAVLGPATDGGWWLLGLREPAHARLLRGVPMSTVDTCALTAAALRRGGLRVAQAPELSDVDTAGDAHAVAEVCPDGRFAGAVRRHVPAAVARISEVAR
jgi:rSAM/selenodomain-associated transferase 1